MYQSASLSLYYKLAPPPLKSQEYRSRASYHDWSGSPEQNHKAAKPASYVGPSSTHQQNAIYGPSLARQQNTILADRWRANDGLLIVVFRSSRQFKRKDKVGPPLRQSGFAHKIEELIRETLLLSKR